MIELLSPISNLLCLPVVPPERKGRNFFGSMNWIGIAAVYPGIEPKVKRSITQTVPIVPVVSAVSNGRKHCADFWFRNSAISLTPASRLKPRAIDRINTLRWPDPTLGKFRDQEYDNARSDFYFQTFFLLVSFIPHRDF